MGDTLRNIFSSLCALVVCVPLQARADCQLRLIASLPISFDDAGGTLVPVKVDGQDVELLVDTGGVGSMLTAAAADRLGLETHHIGSAEFRMFGGVHIDRYVTTHDILIGNLKAADYEFQILPDGVLPKGVSGTLAPDILLAFDNDFDFANARLNLISADHCPGEVVYWTKEPYAELHFQLGPAGSIQLHVELDGKSVLAGLDTGSSESSLSLDSAEQLFGFSEQSPELKVAEGAINGLTAIRTYVYPFKTLSFGGVTVTNPKIHLNRMADSQMEGAPRFLLGMNVLRQLHLYISYKDKTLYITGASAHR